MRILTRLTIAALLLSAAPASIALAEPYTVSAKQSAALDDLFQKLSAATSEAQARGLADQIWDIWISPDDPELAARVEEIFTAGGFAGPASQLPLIDELIADYPDYSEAWNLRATAHFMRGEYPKSLADIEETLKREPRHFGALSGRALILESQGKRDEALEAIEKALEVHPFLPERNLFPELGDPPIRS
ncbi:tetratricopeptide repeat protein [Devosia sediminis]|uniref:Tetratricopeptide repeat protein n=1 Tax=Devosia sediminis TaxID=2798801 RepID=A0A934ITX8_9HYPH|nr:tetratricopeptide repeat protein [Devosia sediminis]MBJ3786698.1 tetratricopeptide repeat protein [Devosia sediminis]